jgi:hypothetical protein
VREVDNQDEWACRDSRQWEEGEYDVINRFAAGTKTVLKATEGEWRYSEAD